MWGEVCSDASPRIPRKVQAAPAAREALRGGSRRDWMIPGSEVRAYVNVPESAWEEMP